MPNARAFAERAALEVARARRTGKPLTVAYADVDDFKIINDRYGHSYGDGVLRSVAAILKANLRETDIVARVGGDEFIILLPETNANQARVVLSKLHSVLSVPAPESESNISLSIGAVVFDEPPLRIEALMNASDAAMYSAKSTGKNNFHIESFSEESVSVTSG
jgi:diguanylate cyclase (GGDEF)-like protein